MRILLIGKNGQIGWELKRQLTELGDIIAPGREQLDLGLENEIRQSVQQAKPDLIVNAAAYTAVDKAEEEPELAMAVNGRGPGILADEAQKTGAPLIHFSTDYVFDGKKKSGPYLEEDLCHPENVYGQSKRAGEEAIVRLGGPHIILRCCGVYGLRGRNFMRTILNRADEGKELRVVNDQIGSPTWCGAIAQATKRIVLHFMEVSSGNMAENMQPKSGIYHLSCRGETSWYGFARAILDITNHPLPASKLISIPTSGFPTAAKRPAYSVLGNDKIARALQIEMPAWEESLKMCLDNQSRA